MEWWTVVGFGLVVVGAVAGIVAILRVKAHPTFEEVMSELKKSSLSGCPAPEEQVSSIDEAIERIKRGEGGHEVVLRIFAKKPPDHLVPGLFVDSRRKDGPEPWPFTHPIRSAYGAKYGVHHQRDPVQTD